MTGCASHTSCFPFLLIFEMSDSKQILNRNHWVFDMDGTLTVAVHKFDEIREELGLEPGLPIVKTLDSMSPEEATPLRLRLQNIEIELARQAQPAEGLEGLLSTLQSKGCKLGIITLNTRENAWITLEALGIDGFFEDFFVMGRFCSLPKPSPEGVKKMMQEWQTDEEDTLVVGDFLYDLQMGRSAGTATVHVDPTSQFLWPEMADFQCSSLKDLQQLLS